jgi:hypothetical protein
MITSSTIAPILNTLWETENLIKVPLSLMIFFLWFWPTRPYLVPFSGKRCAMLYMDPLRNGRLFRPIYLIYE